MSSRRRDKMENGHQMDVLERGNLDDISRPSSNRVIRSDRATTSATSSMGVGSASSVSRLRPQVAAALQLLTPEEVMEPEYELDLEDFSGSSDETSDGLEEITGRTSELFRIAEPLKETQDSEQMQELYQSDEDDKQIVLFGSLCGDDETMVDSDEEKAIMKDIRAEITAQIRGEMKSELEMYKKKREALTSALDCEKEKKDDLAEDMDPELRAAIIKMRKLDKVLDRKVKREKEVKRERILLQRRLHEELVNLKPEGRELKEVQVNTAKFLSLTLPPSHNSGIKVDDLEPEGIVSPHPPVTPVFATQYEDDSQSTDRSSKTSRSEAPSEQSKSGGKTQSSTGRESNRTNGLRPGDHEDAQSTFSGVTNSTNLTGSTNTRRRKKNFIRRNKELASDAANLIAMTDEEKNRVDNLLFNLDTLPEEDLGGDINAFQIVPSLGEGYQPERGDMMKLQDIDHRLKSLLPPEEFAMIAAPPTARSIISSLAGEGSLFTRTALDCETETGLGEGILKDTKEERDVQNRLRDIEGELNTLTSAVEHEMECPKLTNDQLQGLLDKCASAMQRAQDETDHLAQSQNDSLTSARTLMLENAPHLEDHVLQGLLADARSELRLTPSAQSTTPGIDSDQPGEGETDLGVKIQELLANSRLRSRNTSRMDYPETPSDAISVPLDSNQQQFSLTTTEERDSPSPNQYSSGGDIAPTNARKTPDVEYYSRNSAQRKPHGSHHGSSSFINEPPPNETNDLHLMSYDEEMMESALEKNGLVGSAGERQGFLPMIDPHGSLVGTPKHARYSGYNIGNMDDDNSSIGSNSARSSYSKMNSATMLQQGRQPSLDGDMRTTPHPPEKSRPHGGGGSAGKHRSIISRNNGELKT